MVNVIQLQIQLRMLVCLTLFRVLYSFVWGQGASPVRGWCGDAGGSNARSGWVVGGDWWVVDCGWLD